jgi:hypothetical protein
MEAALFSYLFQKIAPAQEDIHETSPGDAPPGHYELVTPKETFTLDLFPLQGSEFFIPEGIAALAPQLVFAFGSNEDQSLVLALGSRIQLLLNDTPSDFHFSLTAVKAAYRL